ncbi:ATP-binding protein [Phyllobacterium myrsinacearum]|uniref:histidine kinase n=1 Tax=Phyllobacterium myrsinacearum TaxID=28101 RepID=A0A839ERD0_9HYPH|nr:ATP-binding protein [Phyllobacterium myrsinacearum]MBA8878997.1 two-component system sensor histidine kinase QseC [Phyllobacterium myrsinacearum]
MMSLRKRLFVILVAATSLIWLCAVVWIYIGSRSELEHVLDTRLQEAARMVHSLVGRDNMAASAAIVPAPATTPEMASYERQLSCQIWSLDGRLMARSSGAPDAKLAENVDGFSDRVVDGELWRVYTIEDQEKGVRVMVGDRIGLRDRLVNDLIFGLMAPALLIVPLLGLLIWVSLGRGLRPLDVMADALRNRDADDMRPIDTGRTLPEVRLLTDALNGLFGKVEAARRHERETTAFAAHELRTPLAGLKTQAQIALTAKDAGVRENALSQILVSVDRTTRLVRQLLTLARLEAENRVANNTSSAAAELLTEIINAAAPLPANIGVEIDPALAKLMLTGERESWLLALRNLHENAIHHMPGGGVISWHATPDGKSVMVLDDGPGIPNDEIDQVTQRFYRGRHKSASGTGLGLTIVEIAAKRVGAKLLLENRTTQTGLQAALIFPYAVSRSP